MSRLNGTVVHMITSPWHQMIGAYLTYLGAGGSPQSTIGTRRDHLYLFARLIGGDPWTATPDALLAAMQSMDCAQETRRGRRTSLRAFYRWAVDAGHTATNTALCLPVVKAGRPNPRPVPDRAYKLALADAKPRERLMVRLAAEMGMRRAEVATVHSRNIIEDLEGWSLIVMGKGRKERTIPMPASLAAELRALPPGWAFPGQIDGHLSPRYVGTLVSRLLPDAWTMHKLRHRAATRWYAVDRDVFTVQDLLGHASPATTRAYVAIPNESLRKTVEAAA
jgi:integrase/recombinase XerC